MLVVGAVVVADYRSDIIHTTRRVVSSLTTRRMMLGTASSKSSCSYRSQYHGLLWMVEALLKPRRRLLQLLLLLLLCSASSSSSFRRHNHSGCSSSSSQDSNSASLDAYTIASTAGFPCPGGRPRLLLEREIRRMPRSSAESSSLLGVVVAFSSCPAAAALPLFLERRVDAGPGVRCW